MSEIIEDGADNGSPILAELGRDDAVVNQLIERLKSESDTTTRDSTISAPARLDKHSKFVD